MYSLPHSFTFSHLIGKWYGWVRGMPAPPHALSPIRPWRGLFLLAAPRTRRGLASTRSCSPAPCGPSGVVGASGG
jgi:hypothetical protein